MSIDKIITCFARECYSCRKTRIDVYQIIAFLIVNKLHINNSLDIQFLSDIINQFFQLFIMKDLDCCTRTILCSQQLLSWYTETISCGSISNKINGTYATTYLLLENIVGNIFYIFELVSTFQIAKTFATSSTLRFCNR